VGSNVAEPILRLSDVRAGYADSVVLDGISLDVPANGSLAVIGRNGVGKTTLLLTIMGFTTMMSGAIEWKGRDITAMPPHRRARNGLGWVPQERDIFPSLTVEENLTVAARPGGWGIQAMYDLFPRLAERRQQMGNHLSGGEQQMLTIARTLMTNPALLLLDEPVEGLAPIVIEELVQAIERMVADGSTAVILVEQHAEVALELTEDTIAVERGAIVHSGPSRALLQDPALLDRFIGVNLAGGADGA